MKARSGLLSAVLLFASAIALAGCGGSSSASYTIGGSVVNLAGVGGGLILQDSRGEQVAVQANGSFMLPEPLASGHSYDITISTQPTNPTQICRVTDGSGVAIGDVTNIEVNCGHNEWMWAAGPDTGQPNGVYGNMGTAATTNIRLEHCFR